MAFKYSCFISYCNCESEQQNNLLKNFVTQIKDLLSERIGLLLNESVYIDKERLKPGYRFNEALAEAICRSVCMVVVYVPRYKRSSYCLREYMAMEILQERRFDLIGKNEQHEKGLIIPIILRGEKKLPGKIKNKIQFCDFSNFLIADENMGGNVKFLEKIEEIARYIEEIYEYFEKYDVDFCGNCDSFKLPSEDDLKPWHETDEKLQKKLPFH